MSASGAPPTVPLYQVQLEIGSAIVSYEVATPDFDALEIATEHLRREVIGDPLVNSPLRVIVGAYSVIGEPPIKGIVAWERKR